jgi:hypothetical protein
MDNNKLHLTVEVLRSRTVQYIVITICLILLMWVIRKWFVPPKRINEEKNAKYPSVV